MNTPETQRKRLSLKGSGFRLWKFGLLLSWMVISGGRMAAQPVIEWQRFLPGSGWDIAYTADTTIDGGFVLAGNPLAFQRTKKIPVETCPGWVVTKLDSLGKTVWQQCINPTEMLECFSIRQAKDGTFLLAGLRKLEERELNSGSPQNFMLVKLDPSGNLLWMKFMEGYNLGSAVRAEPLLDGGIISVSAAGRELRKILPGYQEGQNTFPGFKYYDALVTRMDGDGNVLWKRELRGNPSITIYSVRELPDGFLLGGSETVADLPGGYSTNQADAVIIKLDLNGEMVWKKSFGGKDMDHCMKAEPASDGGVIACGYGSSVSSGGAEGHGSSDIWVAKLSAAGEREWYKIFGSPGYEFAMDIDNSGDGGFILCGTTLVNFGEVQGNHGGHDLWFIKLNSNGSALWKQHFGGSGVEMNNGGVPDGKGGFLFVGHTTSTDGDVKGNSPSDFHNLWIVKFKGIVENRGVSAEPAGER